MSYVYRVNELVSRRNKLLTHWNASRMSWERVTNTYERISKLREQVSRSFCKSWEQVSKNIVGFFTNSFPRHLKPVPTKYVARSHELLSHSNDLLSRSHDLLVCCHDINKITPAQGLINEKV